MLLHPAKKISGRLEDELDQVRTGHLPTKEQRGTSVASVRSTPLSHTVEVPSRLLGKSVGRAMFDTKTRRTFRGSDGACDTYRSLSGGLVHDV